MYIFLYFFFFFFFNDTATTEIYTLSLHDALPIFGHLRAGPLALARPRGRRRSGRGVSAAAAEGDRKSTRLNSSHLVISYAVFCLKKKKYTNVPMKVSNQSVIGLTPTVLPAPL